MTMSGQADELMELRHVTRRFLADKASLADVRRLVEGGESYDRSVWAQMAEQVGLQGIAIPEEYGGAGLGPIELGIVCEELGRALYGGPFFSTVVLAAQTLVAAGDSDAQQRWFPAIVSGELTATLAVADGTGEIDASAVTTTAEGRGDEWVLRGTKRFVVDGHTADLLLVAASVGDEIGLFAVTAEAPGLRREALPQLDPTRQVSTVVLDGTLATRIGGDAVGVLGHVRDLVSAHLAAEQVGGAAAALEMAVEYAKVREQFGRPIGSFQAIKHKCADRLVEVESARNVAAAAAAQLATGHPDASLTASAAAAWAGPSFTRVAKDNIQIHGGIGFTWEHDSHFFLKRAKSSEVLFGSPAQHRARVADLAGI
jgi:alkylation response protein AidB-like acyl-CoA dehydrogenase